GRGGERGRRGCSVGSHPGRAGGVVSPGEEALSMTAPRLLVAVFALGALMAAGVGQVGAEPVKCQKTIVKELAKLKKQVLKRSEKCLDNHNLGKITDDCPDAAAQEKIQTTQDKAIAKIALNCPDPDRTTLGFGTSCAFESAPSAAEADCAAMTPTITSPSDLATCLACWKQAELFEFVATVYAPHPLQCCGGRPDETPPCAPGP